MRAFVRSLSSCFALAAILALPCACRSAWIQAVIVNNQDTPVNIVMVDYPGGTFGVQSIAPHASFRYRFHLLGTDKVSLEYTDAAQDDVKSTGPNLVKGQAGTLRIEIEPANKVQWLPSLAEPK